MRNRIRIDRNLGSVRACILNQVFKISIFLVYFLVIVIDKALARLQGRSLLFHLIAVAVGVNIFVNKGFNNRIPLEPFNSCFSVIGDFGVVEYFSVVGFGSRLNLDCKRR